MRSGLPVSSVMLMTRTRLSIMSSRWDFDFLPLLHFLEDNLVFMGLLRETLLNVDTVIRASSVETEAVE